MLYNEKSSRGKISELANRYVDKVTKSKNTQEMSFIAVRNATS